MSIWVAQAELALSNAVVVFLLTFVPIVTFQTRRLGRPNVARILGAVAIALYVTALLTYTWLPLPDPVTLTCTVEPQLTPLRIVGDVARAVETTGVGTALASFTVLQGVFNVVLTVPWGVLVRRYLGLGVLATTATGLALSAVIEVAQLTGLFGIYPCAYRVFDVDDLALNTLGALVGALIAPALLWWMPHAREVAAQRLSPRPVTVWRRWLGMLIDAFAFWALSVVLSVSVLIAGLALGHHLPDGVGSTGWVGTLVGTVLPWVVVFVVPAWSGYAASGGQTAMWLTPMWRDGHRLVVGTRWQRVLRANVVAGPLVVGGLVQETLGASGFVVPVTLALVAASVVLVPFTRTHRSLSGWLLGAEMADLRDPEVIAAATWRPLSHPHKAEPQRL